MKRPGFALIEPLVVIAIIVIVAAILSPVFARARENARKAARLSNIRQLGLGAMQYVQDYDESYRRGYRGCGGEFSPIRNTNIAATSWIARCDMIFPYVKNTGVCRCPSLLTACDYGDNPWLMPRSYTPITPLILPQVTHTADTIMFYDTYAGNSRPCGYPWVVNARTAANCEAKPVVDYTSGTATCSYARHTDVCNIAVADGHGKWVANKSFAYYVSNTTPPYATYWQVTRP